MINLNYFLLTIIFIIKKIDVFSKQILQKFDLRFVRSPWLQLNLSFRPEFVLLWSNFEVIGLEVFYFYSKKLSSQLKHCIIIFRAAVLLLEFCISASKVTIYRIFYYMKLKAFLVYCLFAFYSTCYENIFNFEPTCWLFLVYSHISTFFFNFS